MVHRVGAVSHSADLGKSALLLDKSTTLVIGPDQVVVLFRILDEGENVIDDVFSSL